MIADFIFLCCLQVVLLGVIMLARSEAVYRVRISILDDDDVGGVFGEYSRLPSYVEMMEFRHWRRWTTRQWRAWLSAVR